MSANLIPFTTDGGIITSGDITPSGYASPAPNISGFNSISGVSLQATTDITAGGNIDIDGEASVGGNLTIVGNITFSGGGSITEVTSAYGNFFGNSDGSNALYAGVPGGVVVPGGITSFTGDSNAYMQINAQNQNHGTQASMEYVVTGDLGTDTTDYLDLGFSSSSWDGTQDNSLGTAVAARDGYMYVQGGGGGGNLVLGTTTTGTKIKFNAGGPNSANTVATIDAGGFSATGNVTAGHLKGEGGNISNIAVANITGLGNIATINKDGNASNVLLGNGVFSSIPAVTSSIIANGNSNVTIATSAGNVVTNVNGAMATTVSASGIQVGGLGRLLSPGGAASITLNNNGANIPTANVTTLSVSGNANIGNIGTSGLIIANGNITTSNGSFVGNGAGLTNVTVNAAGNIQGTSSNVSLVAGSYTMTFDNTGLLTLPTMGGDEGGEINLGIPITNTTLQNRVAIDVFQDRVRIFEGSANAKGVYINLAQSSAGVGTLLNNRVSGLVNAGTFVTMDLIKATVTTTGNRGLSLATTTGTLAYSIGGTYGMATPATGGSAGTGTLTTTPTASIFNWGFTSTGDMSTYILTDTTNSRAYRITLQIGASFNNNMISIERLI